MKCDKCGYDDNGTGDNSHVCHEANIASFWGFNSREAFDDFVKNGGIKYPVKVDNAPILPLTKSYFKYYSGGLPPKDTLLYGTEDSELTCLGPGVVVGTPKDIEEIFSSMNKKLDPKLAGRFDQGKVDWSQLPFQALEGMVRVLEFGAKKYAKGNWANGGGFDHSRVFNSLMRHLVSYQGGEDLDKESGLPHIDHIMCNAMFMAYYKKNPKTFDKDDRVNWPKDDFKYDI